MFWKKCRSLFGFTPKNSLVFFRLVKTMILVDVRCITLGKKQTEKAENYVPILRSMCGDTCAVIAVFFVDDKTTWAKFGQDFMDLDFWFQDIIFFNKELKWGSYICQDELCCPVEGKSLNDNRVLAGV
jgi:hypothetical protein